MSNQFFIKINDRLPINSQKNTIIKNNIDNSPLRPEITNFYNTNNNNTTIYKKYILDKKEDIPVNNDRRNIRKSLTSSAIRQNKFQWASGKFDQGFPLLSNYNLCPQKIATIFQYGHYHWTQNTNNTSTSFPLTSTFVKVIDADSRLSLNDCNCYDVDFSGEYVLNWSLETGAQLVSSDNPDITLGTFIFYQDDEYFEIFLYPDANLNDNTYVHIRYRIPVRYRYAYGDWTFWESLLIDGILSETEFVKVINCCP